MTEGIQDPILAVGLQAAARRAAEAGCTLDLEVQGHFRLPAALSRLACTMLEDLMEKALQYAKPRQLSLTALGVSQITALDISAPVPEDFSLDSLQHLPDYFQTANGTVAVEAALVPKGVLTKTGTDLLNLQLFVYDYKNEA